MDDSDVEDEKYVVDDPPFKVFVGIDFGTDGSGLAYGLPDGSSYIHNMWDDNDTTTKSKTSVLLDEKGDLICVGSKAKETYLQAQQDKGWMLFETFKMDLYGMLLFYIA